MTYTYTTEDLNEMWGYIMLSISHKHMISNEYKSNLHSFPDHILVDISKCCDVIKFKKEISPISYTVKILMETKSPLEYKIPLDNNDDYNAVYIRLGTSYAGIVRYKVKEDIVNNFRFKQILFDTPDPF